MKTDGGWITVSETARLYDKSRKWVYDQIDRYGLDAQKEGNRTRLLDAQKSISSALSDTQKDLSTTCRGTITISTVEPSAV